MAVRAKRAGWSVLLTPSGPLCGTSERVLHRHQAAGHRDPGCGGDCCRPALTEGRRTPPARVLTGPRPLARGPPSSAPPLRRTPTPGAGTKETVSPVAAFGVLAPSARTAGEVIRCVPLTGTSPHAETGPRLAWSAFHAWDHDLAVADELLSYPLTNQVRLGVASDPIQSRQASEFETFDNAVVTAVAKAPPGPGPYFVERRD